MIWHIAQILPRLKLNKKEIEKCSHQLRQWLDTSDSQIVKVNCLQALFELNDNPHEDKEFMKLLKDYQGHGSASLKARAGRLMQTQKPDKKQKGKSG